MTGGELQQNIMLRHLENTDFLQRMVLQAFGRRGRVPNSLFAVEHLLGHARSCWKLPLWLVLGLPDLLAFRLHRGCAVFCRCCLVPPPGFKSVGFDFVLLPRPQAFHILVNVAQSFPNCLALFGRWPKCPPKQEPGQWQREWMGLQRLLEDCVQGWLRFFCSSTARPTRRQWPAPWKRTA